MNIKIFDIPANGSDETIERINKFLQGNGVLDACSEKNCQGEFFAVSPTGDIMPCGRFCDIELKKYAYGNLHKESLSDILLRIKTSNAYKRAEYIDKAVANSCKYFDICHGGCLHDGFLKSGNFRSKTFLCSAYKKIFAHIDKRLKGTIKQLS